MTEDIIKKIHNKALLCGFEEFGVTNFENFDFYTKNLLNFIKKEYHGEMKWIKEKVKTRQNPKNIVAGNNCTEIKKKYNYVVAIEKIEEGLTKRIEFTALEHAAAYYNKSTRTIFRVIREKSSLKSINVTFELL